MQRFGKEVKVWQIGGGFGNKTEVWQRGGDLV